MYASNADSNKRCSILCLLLTACNAECMIEGHKAGESSHLFALQPSSCLVELSHVVMTLEFAVFQVVLRRHAAPGRLAVGAGEDHLRDHALGVRLRLV